MPPDQVLKADALAWLRRAAEDMRAARVDLEARPPLREDALFHCQQAAEKALKAFLTAHDLPFRKTHDLVELGQACCALDATLEPLLRRTAALTEYAWRYRYPGQEQVPSAQEAAEALELAGQTHQAIQERLAHLLP